MRQKKKKKHESKEFVTVTTRKNDVWEKVVYWAARGLGILIAVFWLAYILQSHGFSFFSLTESIIIVALVAVLLLAWKYEIAGGIIYILLGIIYLIVALFKGDTMVMIIVATPPIVTGGLFITEGMLKLQK
ncbi:hypothetical protein ACFL0V_04270 [Nanoarchaeota archaeon]